VMNELIADPAEAKRLGEGACRQAMERFNIQRFSRDWDEVFNLVAENSLTRPDSLAEVFSVSAGGKA
jgi:glycosyltransferase involved in cell wall biosynthesis